MSAVIGSDGFRLNVGIVIINDHGQVLLARKHKRFCWQFPQGGIDSAETEEEALFRELKEEIGLDPCHVEIIRKSESWYLYRLPHKFLRPHVLGETKCIGQKQRWFLLHMIGNESDINLGDHNRPEFCEWGWFDPEFSIRKTIYFKKNIYRRVITEFSLL